MIKYNFERIFRARGIARPFSFLQRNGFSDNFASRINNNRVARLDMKQLERLCLLLKCTPNDIMEWNPESVTDLDKSHPLNEIRRPIAEVDMVKTISSIPLCQLEEIENLIKEQIEKTHTNPLNKS